MTRLNFHKSGKGEQVILIHGFPMNSAVWQNSVVELSKNFTVFTIDLPGFGKSPALGSAFTISDVAENILEWMEDEQISNSVVIGHSLGGYVTLSMADKKPDSLAGFGLFHSTAYADTAEKKQSRVKAIEFIDKNGVQAFTSNFIAPLFVDQQHPAIARIRQIATQSSAEAVKGYTLAMRDRPDLTSVLKRFNNPILFLAGEKDNGIPSETILKQSVLSQNSEVHVLEGVAHMGMFENPSETTRIIAAFCAKCFH
jgi:pimeloyl-ACP methyl ester carboxylesterase